MFKYDPTHSRFEGTVETKDGKLVTNGRSISAFAERDLSNIPWGQEGVVCHTVDCESELSFD